MRILVTGSRDWTDGEAIEKALIQALGADDKPWDHTVVHGGARGADQIAGQIARRLGLNVEEHPADWGRFGKRAGYLRNAEMVESGVHVCLAFIKNQSRGATMCADLAEKAGVLTSRHTSGPLAA